MARDTGRPAERTLVASAASSPIPGCGAKPALSSGPRKTLSSRRVSVSACRPLDSIFSRAARLGSLGGHGLLGLTVQRRVARGQQRGLPAGTDEYAGQPQSQDLADEDRVAG